MTLAAFLTVAFLHLLAAISPGPAVILSARTGLTEGPRTGAFLAAGIGAGAVIWAAAALFGLALLFQVAPALLWALKIFGAAYLLWLGYTMWRDASLPLETETGDRPPRTTASAFRLGLFTQLANPKPAVLFSAIFIGTVPPEAPFWIYMALLVVVFLNEAVWNMSVARVFALEQSRTTYISLKTIIDRSFGGLLALLGVKIVTT
ncbi:threonine/homoserine/homoserine lactone efflux protein [Sulfitobacter undariae]|uniref:Threonine/homoserine/homoserine lactone efflux protein n=1 Tax=Sulfitobacter undariae TaxID=1563671 RepID=A0A7W6E8R0_9RHOB|nr:LysE family translocator [Sulfitobacter undariae]MBB3993823.1 threonine/homoserine/homoserine lactone efflux protein [Sulfitobacter undariae]